MSETTTLLKAGATDLVLRMIEAATVLPDLTLDHPLQAIDEISRDITGRSRVRLADGRQMSALDIQREYLARAKDFTGQRGADSAGASSGCGSGRWTRSGQGTLTPSRGRSTGSSNTSSSSGTGPAHDLPLSAPQVAQADLAYHDVQRGRGLYYQLQRGDAVDRTARDIDIFEAKTVPPVPGRYRQAG